MPPFQGYGSEVNKVELKLIIKVDAIFIGKVAPEYDWMKTVALFG